MPRPQRQDFPDFTNQKLELERFFAELPTIVGNLAVNFTDDRFREGGFIRSSFEKWAPRAKADKNKKSRALLVASGALRRATGFRAGDMEVMIFNPLKYASAHNSGEHETVHVASHTRKVKGKVQNVKAHTMKMNIPQREFIGNSEFLNKRIEAHIERALEQIFKK